MLDAQHANLAPPYVVRPAYPITVVAPRRGCQAASARSAALGLDHLHVRPRQERPFVVSKIDLEDPDLGLGLEGHELGRQGQDLPEAPEVRLSNGADQAPH